MKKQENPQNSPALQSLTYRNRGAVVLCIILVCIVAFTQRDWGPGEGVARRSTLAENEDAPAMKCEIIAYRNGKQVTDERYLVGDLVRIMVQSNRASYKPIVLIVSGDKYHRICGVGTGNHNFEFKNTWYLQRDLYQINDSSASRKILVLFSSNAVQDRNSLCTSRLTTRQDGRVLENTIMDRIGSGNPAMYIGEEIPIGTRR